MLTYFAYLDVFSRAATINRLVVAFFFFNNLLVLADFPRSTVEILLFQFLKWKYFPVSLLFCNIGRHLRL